jgi:hypothetical protein
VGEVIQLSPAARRTHADVYLAVMQSLIDRYEENPGEVATTCVTTAANLLGETIGSDLRAADILECVACGMRSLAGLATPIDDEPRPAA